MVGACPTCPKKMCIGIKPPPGVITVQKVCCNCMEDPPGGLCWYCMPDCPTCQAGPCAGIAVTESNQTICCNCKSPPRVLCSYCNDRRIVQDNKRIQQDKKDLDEFWKENKISPRPLWAKDWYPWEAEVRDLVGDLQNENKLLKEEILATIKEHPILIENPFIAEAHRLVNESQKNDKV